MVSSPKGRGRTQRTCAYVRLLATGTDPGTSTRSTSSTVGACSVRRHKPPRLKFTMRPASCRSSAPAHCSGGNDAPRSYRTSRIRANRSPCCCSPVGLLHSTHLLFIRDISMGNIGSGSPCCPDSPISIERLLLHLGSNAGDRLSIIHPVR